MKEFMSDFYVANLPFWPRLLSKLQRRLMRAFDVFLFALVALLIVAMWPFIRGKDDDDDKLT